MPVTLVYEPHDSPLAAGAIGEAAVYATLEEALFQAAWDEMTAPNRFPSRIIDGAHHGSPGWERRNRRRGGRPRHMDERKAAADADAKVLVDFDENEAALEAAITVVRRHWVVHPDDVADPKAPPYGSPRERANTDFEVSPSVAACFEELRGLK